MRMSKQLRLAKLWRMQIRFLILIHALAFGWGMSVSADDTSFQSPLLAVFEAGVVCAIETGLEREAPNTVAGSTHVITAPPPFISTDRVVPAVLGFGFGVRAGLKGDLTQNGVVVRVTHPPFAGTGATEQSFVTRIGPETDPGVTFYQFDHGYELVTGDWTIKGSMGAVTLFETTFTVVPPDALPELAGACGYQDLLG